MVHILSPLNNSHPGATLGPQRYCVQYTRQNMEVSTHYLCRYMYKALAKRRTWHRRSSLLFLGMLCMQNLQGLWLHTTNGCVQSCMWYTYSYHSTYQTIGADHMHTCPFASTCRWHCANTPVSVGATYPTHHSHSGHQVGWLLISWLVPLDFLMNPQQSSNYETTRQLGNRWVS